MTNGKILIDVAGEPLWSDTHLKVFRSDQEIESTEHCKVSPVEVLPWYPKKTCHIGNELTLMTGPGLNVPDDVWKAFCEKIAKRELTELARVLKVYLDGDKGRGENRKGTKGTLSKATG